MNSKAKINHSNMLSNNMSNNSNSRTAIAVMLPIVGITAGTVFMAAAYYLPVDSFMGFFAAGLFLIPTAFFVYMVQKMEKGGDNTQVAR